VTVAAERGTLLIVAHAFPPAPAAGAMRPGRFARYLSAHGYRVLVLTATAASPAAFPDVTYVSDQPLARFPRAQRALRLAELAAARLTFPGGEHHSLAWVPAARRAAVALARSHSVTHVLSTFPPLAPHFVGAAVKRRFPGMRWIADFRDPLGRNPATQRRAEHWFQRFERQFVGRADQVIVNTDVVAESLRATYPEWAGKITHVWNGYDPDEALVPLLIPPRQARHLVHVGEIYGGRHPGLLLAALERLSSSGRLAAIRLQVQLLGELDRDSLPEAAALDRLVAARHVVVSPAPRWGEAARRAMAEADFLLIIDWAGPDGGRQVPSKLFSYVRIGRPILAITTGGSPTDRILQRSGVPYAALYPGESVDRHADTLLAFASLSSAPARPSDWFVSEFDGRRQVATVAALLGGSSAASA
jgi:glycosyltransferase involved in cell wall biosynthesis